MPSRRYKKRSKKRRYRRKGYNQLVSTRNPFPKSMITKHRYVSTHTLTPSGAALIASYQFRGNSLYDPDYTSAGHQPLGFDEYSNLYEHFTVLGSKISITAATGGIPVVVGITRDSDATLTVNYDTVQENADTVWGSHASGSKPLVLRAATSMKKWFNRKAIKDDPKLRGTPSTDCEETMFYHLWVKALSATAVPSATDINVVIEYIALWSEPKELVQS